MRIGRPNNAASKTQVVVLTADAGFEEQARATFGASEQIELRLVSGTLAGARATISTSRAPPSPSSISTPATAGRDAGARAADGAHRYLAAGRRRHAGFRRERRAHAVADARGRFPGEAGLPGRAGADLRARRQGSSHVGADRGADLHLPAGGRRRRRHHARDPNRDDAAQQRPAREGVDLPGRPRFPARRLRRLSRPRAAAQYRRDRAAPGAARPAVARGHAVASSVRPRGGRRAEPAGRDALVRPGRGDAPARSGVVAFRLCRVRHAAHLVLLDRQRAARLQQDLHRQRDDGAGAAPRQAAGRGDPRAAGRRAAAAGDHQSLRAENVLVRPAQGRHRAGARRFLRRLHSEQLRPGARSDRPRRSAR